MLKHSLRSALPQSILYALCYAACTQMKRRILQLITDSFGSQLYAKAQDCIVAFRQQAVKVSLASRSSCSPSTAESPFQVGAVCSYQFRMLANVLGVLVTSLLNHFVSFLIVSTSLMQFLRYCIGSQMCSGDKTRYNSSVSLTYILESRLC